MRTFSYSVAKGEKFTMVVEKEEADITAEMMQNGSWKTAAFKKYNFNAMGTVPDSGHLHPLMKVRSEFRQIFFELGYWLCVLIIKIVSQRCQQTSLSNPPSGISMHSSSRNSTQPVTLTIPFSSKTPQPLLHFLKNTCNESKKCTLSVTLDRLDMVMTGRDMRLKS